MTALVPVLLLLAYLPGETMLRCRIDGLLRPTCCCPDPSQEPDPGPVLKAQGCCDQTTTTGGERPVVEAARRIAPEAPLAIATAFAASVLDFDLTAPARVARAWRAQAPPRDGPPLVLLKHAFLI
jgi:hypothetical protein